MSQELRLFFSSVDSVLFSKLDMCPPSNNLEAANLPILMMYRREMAKHDFTHQETSYESVPRILP